MAYRAAELVLAIHPQNRRHSSTSFVAPSSNLSVEEEDAILLAQNHMRERSYHKVIRSLARYGSPKSIWLRTYSEFLVGRITCCQMKDLPMLYTDERERRVETVAQRRWYVHHDHFLESH